MRLGERIRRERKDRKMSQGDAANLLGVGQPTISRWEAGDRVDPANFAVVAGFLGLTEADVAVLSVAGDEEPVIRRLEAEVSGLRAELEAMRAELEDIRQGGRQDPPAVIPSDRAARRPRR